MKHLAVLLPLALAGCATSQLTAPASPPVPPPPGIYFTPSSSTAGQLPPQQQDLVWMRTDGQKMTGNPALQQLFFQAQQACTNNATQPPVVSASCMSSKGYVSVPRPAQ